MKNNKNTQILRQEIANLLNDENWLSNFDYLQLMTLTSQYAPESEKEHARNRIFDGSIKRHTALLKELGRLDGMENIEKQVKELETERHQSLEKALETFQPEPLELDERIINDYKINIRSGSSILVGVSQVKKISKEDMMEKAKQVAKLAKEHDVKLRGRNKLYKKIREDYGRYETAVLEYQRVYNELKEKCENKTFYLGYSADYYYNQEILKNGQFKLQRMLYGTEPISQFHNKAKKLDSLLNRTDWGHMITLWV